MKRKVILITLAALALVFIARATYFIIGNATYQPQHGDIIFHVSESTQSAAIKIGTLSRYSHCGIIVIENGKTYVIEAENGVERTPIRQWLKRGKMGHHYRVMRLKNVASPTLAYKKTLGIPYDKAFRLNNGKYYCSELVWELYKEKGILLSDPNPLSDYHFLYLPVIQKHAKKRGFTPDQLVVPPSDLLHSKHLRTVTYGYGTPLWLK